jgi:hypothetical protein
MRRRVTPGKRPTGDVAHGPMLFDRPASDSSGAGHSLP